MIRFKHFEFWNTHVFHLPIYLYWLYLSCKAKTLFFFSAANPGIETGGLMGESKYDILAKIHPAYVPATLYFKKTLDLDTVLQQLQQSGICFPFVIKPDIGQGGWLIDKIHDEDELARFLLRIKMPFMIQEYIDLPLEVGLLYYRFPGEEKGVISSLALKDLLSVTGDGQRTVYELLKADRRGRTQLQRLVKNKRIDLNVVLPKGEKRSLSFIGNHSYGTMFTNGNHLVDETLRSLFDDVCRNIAGFYFGRFDIRCASLDALKRGEFKVLELNGVGSEPLHIFDPREKLFNAYASAMEHWRVIYKISRLNRCKTACMSLKEAWEAYKNVLRIQRMHATNFTIGN